MKNDIKYFLTVVIIVLVGFIALADETEDIEFEPIHSTITPGSGQLKFEDVYGKKAMITSNGDALVFKSVTSIITNNIELPINAMQDYSMEFTFIIPKFVGWISMNFTGYCIKFGKKMADAYAVDPDIVNPSEVNNKNLFKDAKEIFKKKFDIPAGGVKNQFVCKIVKRKKIVTVFINGKYVSEFNIKPMNPIINLTMDFNFRTEGELQSIRIDQGPEVESDD